LVLNLHNLSVSVFLHIIPTAEKASKNIPKGHSHIRVADVEPMVIVKSHQPKIVYLFGSFRCVRDGFFKNADCSFGRNKYSFSPEFMDSHTTTFFSNMADKQSHRQTFKKFKHKCEHQAR